MGNSGRWGYLCVPVGNGRRPVVLSQKGVMFLELGFQFGFSDKVFDKMLFPIDYMGVFSLRYVPVVVPNATGIIPSRELEPNLE